MAIYVITWIAIFAPYLFPNRHEYKNYSRFYAVYIFMCFTLLIGLKHTSVGIDTVVYEEFYNRADEMVQSVSYEKGYYTFTYLISELGIGFHGFEFIVACILMASLVWFYSVYSKNLAFSVFIFMTIGLLTMYMSGIRQSLALSICLVAMGIVDKRRGIIPIIVAMLLIWLATTFHVSSVVCFIAVAVIAFRIRLSRPILMGLVIVCAAALFYRYPLVGFIQQFIPHKYSGIDLNENYQINPLLFVIAILIPAFCIVFDTNVEKDGKYNSTKTWFYLFSCANIVLNILAQNSMYFSRVAFYFLHMNSVLIPNMIEEQRLEMNNKLMYVLIGFTCMIYFLMSTPGGMLQIDEYKFFWQ